MRLFLVDGDKYCPESNTDDFKSIIAQAENHGKGRGDKYVTNMLQLVEAEYSEVSARPDLRSILLDAVGHLLRGDYEGFILAFMKEAAIRYKAMSGNRPA